MRPYCRNSGSTRRKVSHLFIEARSPAVTCSSHFKLANTIVAHSFICCVVIRRICVSACRAARGGHRVVFVPAACEAGLLAITALLWLRTRAAGIGALYSRLLLSVSAACSCPTPSTVSFSPITIEMPNGRLEEVDRRQRLRRPCRPSHQHRRDTATATATDCSLLQAPPRLLVHRHLLLALEHLLLLPLVLQKAASKRTAKRTE